MPTGIPKAKMVGAQSEQTRRLIEALQDIEDRLAAERRKDSARLKLLAFAKKHDLSAADLRAAATLLGAREKGTDPVMSTNFTSAKRKAMGRKLREARKAKGIASTKLGALVGAKSSGAVSQWEKGTPPGSEKYRAGLIKHLDLPKDFFAEFATTNRGLARKANGAAAHT